MNPLKWITGIRPTARAVNCGRWLLLFVAVYYLCSVAWRELFNVLAGSHNLSGLINIPFYGLLFLVFAIELYIIGLWKGILNERGVSQLDWYLIMAALFKIIETVFFTLASLAHIFAFATVAWKLNDAGQGYQKVFFVILAISGIFAAIQFIQIKEKILGFKWTLLAAAILFVIAGFAGGDIGRVLSLIADVMCFLFLSRLYQVKKTPPSLVQMEV